MILSASRRTDIPSFYSQWFVNRLNGGYVLTKNPMNPAQISRINLSPELIDCIVFWTKDPENMLGRLPYIDELGYRYYFQFTITPYEKDIERNLRDKKEIIKTFQTLSGMLGKDRTLWRYDPIILNQEFDFKYHITKFTELCNELQGYTDICTISYVDRYSKLSKTALDRVITPIEEEEMHSLSKILSEIGMRYGIELRACSEGIDLSRDGVMPASCIDKAVISRICGYPVKEGKDKNQRPGCGCIQSVDIGVYNTCGHGCIYCYANYGDASIHKNIMAHNPNSELLIGVVGENDRITCRN